MLCHFFFWKAEMPLGADESAMCAIMQFQKLIPIMKPACTLLYLLL